jgi:hypothetical protein
MITCYTNVYIDPTRTTKPTLSPLHDKEKEKRKLLQLSRSSITPQPHLRFEEVLGKRHLFL